MKTLWSRRYVRVPTYMMHVINYGHVLKKHLISNDRRSISLQALPKKFADYLDGQEPAKVYLRAADCGPRLWTVEVLFDGQGRMYLDKGWEKFAIAHGVDFGWFVHFKYEGDDVLTVKVFDGTMCRRYYYSDDEDTDDESDDDVKPCIHPL